MSYRLIIFVSLVCYPYLACNKGYKCLNTMGSYTCFDVDECVEESHSCDVIGTTCKNTIGSYTCADVDECINDLHGCQNTKSACKNTYGSYTCTCLSGYKGSFQHFVKFVPLTLKLL